jgi:hypothetical protein
MAAQEVGEPRGTQVHSPDLNWSQVSETVLMLELAAGQVDAAMRDSNASVDVLADTFTSMASALDAIDERIGSLPAGEAEGAITGIRESAREVARKAHEAIIAFQFYDRLMQRLDHVCLSLGALSNLVSSPGQRYNPQEWARLQELISSRYTMAEERAMFDAVMRGVPVKEALEQYMTARMQEVHASGGDVELF